MTDERLHKAPEFANYRQTFFNRNKQGGTFKVTKKQK